MLLSLLLPLTTTFSIPILSPLGRPFNAWFLEQITLFEPALAASLHDEQGVKPYTVSSLVDERGRPIKPGCWLEAGQVCWLRLTSFSVSLSETLLRQFIPRLPDRLTIYKMTFRLDGWTLDPAQHPWAGQTSFRAMADNLDEMEQPAGSEALASQPSGHPQAGQVNFRPQPSSRARLEFASPTAFRSGGADIPLPIPGLIFRSLWQKWNTCCPEAMQIQDAWPAFAADCLLVNELTAVNTQHWTFAEGSRGGATGFTGTIGFQLATARQSGKWAEFRPGAEKVLQSLAGFAFYSGVGHHTVIGMGMARKVR
jgi:CRISPR-associated endoribonuclease Cas6